MDAIPAAEVSPSAEAARLCLACGFCCDGTLHTYTVLQPDEVGATPLLRAEADEGRMLFRQPCPCFRDGLCTIYADRPRVCRDYQCALLVRRLGSELTHEDCAAIVSTARELFDAIRGEAPGIMAFRALLKAISELADGEEGAGLSSAGRHPLSAVAASVAGRQRPSRGDRPVAPTPSLARLLDTPETLTRILALATHLHQHFDPASSPESSVVSYQLSVNG